MKATLSLPKRLMLVGGATAGLLAMSAVTASASTWYHWGGDEWGANCEAYVGGSSYNWAVGVVSGGSNCSVYLEQWNTQTGGTTTTNWSDGVTTPLYHNDGVHEVRVILWTGTTEGKGPWVN
jgi:hypothetical protein